ETEDVFEHNDGVVDDHTDHQHQRQHRHAIERKVQSSHHAETGNQRAWDGHRRNQCRTPGAHEEQHDETRQYAAEYQVLLNFVQPRFNVARLVADHFHLHIVWKLTGDARHLLLDTF